MSMEQFYTRKKSNDGIRVPLYLPDGTKSEHWLHVLGVDSDVFREAESQINRLMAESLKEADSVSKPEVFKEKFSELRAHLVSDWSFEDECTVENVKNFFKEAPQIGEMVDRFAGNRSLFFVKGLSSSSGTQETNSSSTKSLKDQNKA